MMINLLMDYAVKTKSSIDTTRSGRTLLVIHPDELVEFHKVIHRAMNTFPYPQSSVQMLELTDLILHGEIMQDYESLYSNEEKTINRIDLDNIPISKRA